MHISGGWEMHMVEGNNKKWLGNPVGAACAKLLVALVLVLVGKRFLFCSASCFSETLPGWGYQMLMASVGGRYVDRYFPQFSKI